MFVLSCIYNNHNYSKEFPTYMEAKEGYYRAKAKGATKLVIKHIRAGD